jgi:branched-chain amino acid transport system permease protein
LATEGEAVEQLIQQVASGLANGAIYACLALALVMIFVSTDHINFAQGELAMFSAYMVWQLLDWGVNFWLALPAVAIIAFLVGVAVERIVLRPLHHAPILSVVVVFIGLLAIFHSMAGAIWGHTIKAFPSPFPNFTFAGSGYIGPHQIGMIIVTLMLLMALFAFFRFTPLGLAMRAAAQNPDSARLAGIRVDWMLALGWGLAAAIGTVAGTLVAPVVYLEPNMMASILLYGFAGALVGGISSPGGAVAGGFIVGVLENLVAYFGNLIDRATGVYIVGNGEKLMVALIIVITVLTLKPSGLFGRVTVKRV